MSSRSLPISQWPWSPLLLAASSPVALVCPLSLATSWLAWRSDPSRRDLLVTSKDISQLAEIGVIFLMFGVGLHFSLNDLWAVRKIAVPGAALQMLIATVLGFTLTQFWGWSVEAGLVLGLAISIASTVVLLRGLMDNGLLSIAAGQVAVGWLVLEDLATVLILVL